MSKKLIFSFFSIAILFSCVFLYLSSIAPGSYFCSKRISWEARDFGINDNIGLYHVILLLSDDNLKIEHSVLETQIEIPESSIYIANNTMYDIYIDEIEMSYELEGVVVPNNKIFVMNTVCVDKHCKIIEVNSIKYINYYLNPIRSNDRAEILIQYDFEDSNKFNKAKFYFSMRYKVLGKEYFFNKKIELEKYTAEYNCLIGKGIPKKLNESAQ